MAEMYKIVTDFLFEELKRRINAGIFCDISSDTLTVRLINDSITWECSIPEISKMMAMGLTVNRIADKITNEYKKEIMKRYFY